jgi:hypothetical protein
LDITKNKNVIYTIIIGDYDNLKPPKIITPGWDYICFTDNDSIMSDVWDVKKIPQKCLSFKDPKRNVALLMIEYYTIIDESYNTIISIGGQIQINNNLNDFLNLIEIENYDIVMTKHPNRQCVYNEAIVCKRAKLDFPKIINKQVHKYRTENYPKDNGLWETGVVTRNQKRNFCQKAFFLWGEHYRDGSRRDQLSVNYSFWRAQQDENNLKINTILKKNIFPSFFSISEHKAGHKTIRKINFKNKKLI